MLVVRRVRRNGTSEVFSKVLDSVSLDLKRIPAALARRTKENEGRQVEVPVEV